MLEELNKLAARHNFVITYEEDCKMYLMSHKEDVTLFMFSPTLQDIEDMLAEL